MSKLKLRLKPFFTEAEQEALRQKIDQIAFDYGGYQNTAPVKPTGSWKYGYCKDCGIEMCPEIDRDRNYCRKCFVDEDTI